MTLRYLEGIFLQALYAVLPEEQSVQGLELLDHGRGEVGDEVGREVQELQPIEGLEHPQP